MKLLKIAMLAAALFSSGCATEMAWRRTDGYPIDRSFHRAAAHCRDRADGFAGNAAEAMQRCMARRGYVWTAVPSSGGYGNGNGNGYGDDDDDDD